MIDVVFGANTNIDTIAAIATPLGVSGIAVIRVSGIKAIELVDMLYRGKRDLVSVGSHTAHYGEVVDHQGKAVDKVVCTVFIAPRSYTGEDVVEISCHGGTFIARKILDLCLAKGIRLANPGEFTQRAFINGKLDLVQAEAVADLIHANSENAQIASMKQLNGNTSGFIAELRTKLVQVCSLLELTLDFVEEDVDIADLNELATELEQILQQIDKAILTYSTGRLIRNGVKVVIVGKPNVGKSSLLNTLLNMQRAIVTDTPGTTRDYIEEGVILQGQYFTFIDTAGLRTTNDQVETEGIAISKEQLLNADIALCIIDSSDRETHKKRIDEIKSEFLSYDVKEGTSLYIYNKCDIRNGDINIDLNGLDDVMYVSALTGEHIDDLKKLLWSKAHEITREFDKEEILITNIRHVDCLRKGRMFVNNALMALSDGQHEEVIAVEVRSAANALGEIIGEVVTNDVINNIFSRFCIGK